MKDDRKRPTAEEVSRRCIDRLRRFTKLLKSGVPIEATEVSRIQTPDGPATIRRRVVVEREDGDE